MKYVYLMSLFISFGFSKTQAKEGESKEVVLYNATSKPFYFSFEKQKINGGDINLIEQLKLEYKKVVAHRTENEIDEFPSSQKSEIGESSPQRL